MKTTVVQALPDGTIQDRPDGPRVGDIWFEPDHAGQPWLSAKYYAANPHRAPIVVVVPGGALFCVDSKQSNRERGFFEPGWDVSGPIEAITVNPSINIEGLWHGWLKNGELSPDLPTAPPVSTPPMRASAPILGAHHMPKETKLKTNIGGKFDPAVLQAALAAFEPFEPNTEYVLTLDVAAAAPPAEPAAPAEV